MTAVVDQGLIERIWSAVEENPGLKVTVDLQVRQVRFADVVDGLDVDDYTRWRLLEGLDDVGITLQHADAIRVFETNRPSFKPTTQRAG